MDAGWVEDYGLEPEHRQFRDHFRRFVADRVAPLAARGEREHRFPREVYGVLRDGGFLAVNFPVEIGGGGGDLLMACLFYEELTRASAGVSAGVFAHQHLAAGPVLRTGTEEQKREFLLPALRGELIGAFGLTEPDAGSDIRGMRTTARPDGGDFVLNGSKLYITNGSIADFMLVAARTGEGRGSGAFSIFIVETRDPGVVARDLDKVGNHSSATAFVSLEDVRVPARRVLGEVGRGLGQLKETLMEGRILVANRGLGMAQEAFELILKYSGERQAFGVPIGHFQGVAFKIADMAARLDAVRLMIYRAARLRMAGRDCVREASMAKYLASEAAMRVTSDALLLHGGAGYMEEMKIARLYRDAPEAWIGEGTNEIQLGVIARSLGLA
ncbi:MAG TPA: acyl-CoA dehydrogenase family protein [Methylomirabilota bacterium]|nr:acyl-CoA dehydrogenase family protein [Methylomirabilota bacterium]